MQIQTIKQVCNFGQNVAVYKILSKGINGIETELRGFKATRGPLQALVTRLNQDSASRETQFFKKYITAFREYPKTTSTNFANNHFEQRHLFFGKDIEDIEDLRKSCYKFGNTTVEELRDLIINSFIRPLGNKLRFARFKDDKIGEQVGIVLHTSKKGTKGKYAFGIDITSMDGKRIYAKLPLEESKIPELALTTTKSSPTKIETAKKIEQGNFLDTLFAGSKPAVKPQSADKPWPAYFDHCGWEKPHRKKPSTRKMQVPLVSIK